MTAVGKILVFLNLVFSLVVGGFAVADYTARAHWQEGLKRWKAQYEVVRQANDTYAQELNRLTKEKADLHEKLLAARVNWDPGAKDAADVGSRVGDAVVRVLNERAKSIEELKQQADRLTTQLKDARNENTKLAALQKGFTVDISRRQEDTSLLRNTLDAEMKKNFQLTRDVNQMRDDMITAQIQARTFKDRNSQLEAALRDMASSMAQLRASASAGGATGRPAAAGGANPPSDSVEGKILRVDRDLVTVSLGSDAGLQRGQTLEVFRLGTNARYIGRIKILDVLADQAVGQAQGKLTGPMQLGDRVASRILGN